MRRNANSGGFSLGFSIAISIPLLTEIHRLGHKVNPDNLAAGPISVYPPRPERAHSPWASTILQWAGIFNRRSLRCTIATCTWVSSHPTSLELSTPLEISHSYASPETIALHCRDTVCATPMVAAQGLGSSFPDIRIFCRSQNTSNPAHKYSSID